MALMALTLTWPSTDQNAFWKATDAILPPLWSRQVFCLDFHSVKANPRSSLLQIDHTGYSQLVELRQKMTCFSKIARIVEHRYVFWEGIGKTLACSLNLCSVASYRLTLSFRFEWVAISLLYQVQSREVWSRQESGPGCSSICVIFKCPTRQQA